MADEACPVAKRVKLEDGKAVSKERLELLDCLSRVVESMDSVIVDGEKHIKEAGSVDEYMKLENPRGIKLLFRPMPVYAECISKHMVDTWKDFEEIVRKHYKDEGVKDLVEELLSAEETFEDFIRKREQELTEFEKNRSLSEQDVLTLGKVIPKDLTLIDAQSGDSRPITTFCSKSKYTLFILMRHYG